MLDVDVLGVIDVLGIDVPGVVVGDESHVGLIDGVHSAIARRPPSTATTAAADTAILHPSQRCSGGRAALVAARRISFSPNSMSVLASMPARRLRAACSAR
ncbi:MAG TPA: hypothetical protein PKV27_12155 [Ilumatobacteraceae bacterium]|nr:hypothetical protein [Ilumatobacteraceae bacterium]